MDIQTIIKRAGGPSRIAAEIGRSHSAVCRWKRVPPQHARAVARMADLAPEQIRPDIFGAPRPEALAKGVAA